MLLELSFDGFFSFSPLFLTRKVAKVIGLVDKPNARKQHTISRWDFYLSFYRSISYLKSRCDPILLFILGLYRHFNCGRCS